MDSARADILAAESHLQTHGWVPRRSEAFRHLPPPELAQWLHGTAPGARQPRDEGRLRANRRVVLEFSHSVSNHPIVMP